MAIITLTQHIGTRAFALGRVTAERLNYRFLTADELIARASKVYNIAPEQLVIVDERRPHFWERLKTDTERFVSFFRAVVLKEMAKDKLVIVGRSVAHIMPEDACGLRVRLVGPFKDRAVEIGSEEGLAPAVAERRVRDYDREVRARIQTLMGVDIDDPANYGVTLNTFAMPLETLATALGSLAGEIDHTARPDQWRKLRRHRAGRRGSSRPDAQPENRPRAARDYVQERCRSDQRPRPRSAVGRPDQRGRRVNWTGSSRSRSLPRSSRFRSDPASLARGYVRI